jgi:hypothetical protein
MKCMQDAIRAIPVSIDHALRSLAKNENKNLNEVVIEALARGLELEAKPAENLYLEALIDWHDPPRPSVCSAPWWGVLGAELLRGMHPEASMRSDLVELLAAISDHHLAFPQGVEHFPSEPFPAELVVKSFDAPFR